MADTMTEAQRHYTMSQVHSASTKPELRLRNALWHLGFRYRVNVKRLPGTPDIVLPKYRTVIFVHGCFWHGHKDCKNYTVPKTNTDFWTAKIARNQHRDQEVWRQLEAQGWTVIIVWECQLKKPSSTEPSPASRRKSSGAERSFAPPRMTGALRCGGFFVFGVGPDFSPGRPSGAKTQQNALGPARPWRRFAETLQTGAIVRPKRPIPGASLQHFSRPAPRIQQTGTKDAIGSRQSNVTITNHFSSMIPLNWNEGKASSAVLL